MSRMLELPENYTLDDLIRITKSKPGVDYCVVKLPNMPEAQKFGWRQVPGAPFVSYRGHDCALMYQGAVLPGADDLSTVSSFYEDPSFDDSPKSEKPASNPPPAKKG